MHRYRFFRDSNLLVVEYGRFLDDRGLRDHLLWIYDDPDYVPGMDEVSSFLHTQRVHVTGDGLRGLARLFPRPGHEHAPLNYAAVITDTRLGLGLTRLYGAHSEVGQQEALQSFVTAEDAGDWLDGKRGRAAGSTVALLKSVLTEPVSS